MSLDHLIETLQNDVVLDSESLPLVFLEDLGEFGVVVIEAFVRPDHEEMLVGYLDARGAQLDDLVGPVEEHPRETV